MKQNISGGLVHEMPADMAEALTSEANVIDIWESLTPIARNEFLCWGEDAKQEKTRAKRNHSNSRGAARRAKTPLLLGRLHPSHRQKTKQVATGCFD